MLGRLRSEAGIWFTSAGIFLISAVPAFGRVSIGPTPLNGLSIREFMWAVALVVSWVRGRALEKQGSE